MSAEIVMLPVPARSCYNCENGATTPSASTYCLMFHEVILSEKLAAADCESYTPVE